MINPNIWPANVYVREWIFNKNKKMDANTDNSNPPTTISNNDNKASEGDNITLKKIITKITMADKLNNWNDLVCNDGGDINDDDNDYGNSILNNFFNSVTSTYHSYNNLSINVIKKYDQSNPTHNILSLCHFNSRSLYNKLNSLDIIMKQFNYFFNYIIITESWLNDHTDNLINIPGYYFFSKNRAGKKGGGVGIFVKSDINCTVNENSVFKDDVVDMLCIDMKYFCKVIAGGK